MVRSGPTDEEVLDRPCLAGSEEQADLAQTVIQAPNGHLMCMMQLGALVSVVRVTPARCGGAGGCDNGYYCLPKL